ncbi:MAG TPA: hypothetical protein VK563_20570 [Puia sp.]|nr:hypothetical protein [Puia sp.]
MQRSLHTAGQLIKKKPFFWALVPIFFILKNANIYFNVIPGEQVAWLLLGYMARAFILYFILFRVFAKKNYKAALYCFILLSIYFFFENFDHFLQAQKWLHPFNRYRWSYPALALFLAVIFFYIRRLRSAPERTILFLNLLLIFFCLSEAFPLLYRSVNRQQPLLSIENEPSPLPGPATGTPNAPASTPQAPGLAHSPAHPDIYFILLDEYQGNAGLQKAFNYNDPLGTMLAARGFFAPRVARSNYNYTFFSMPSILNMNYLHGEIQGRTAEEDHLLFSSGIVLIRNSRVIRFLKSRNYEMVNLSPFRLEDSGEVGVSQFKSIIVEKDLIDDQTFFYSAKEKFAWMISDKKILRFLNPMDYNIQYHNEYVGEHLDAASAAPGKNPKFVYAHFFIPHSPFFKDSAGNEVNFRHFIQEKMGTDVKYMNDLYLGYLKYGNTILINSIDTILRHDPGAMIMVMSDHGYRGFPAENKYLEYDNQFYARTPEQNYSGWPDTVDAVNAFRLLFNKEFDQQLGYLPYHAKEFKLPSH